MHKVALIVLVAGGVSAWGQTPNRGNANQKVDRAAAYYNYSLAHMYAELAGAYGNRGDYVDKAIESYKAAIKADPETPAISAELSDLYIQAGRLRDAQNDAEETLKQNPNDVAAHRLLARIFTRQISDGQRTKIDEAMLRKAIEQYEKITQLRPKDSDSWVMLGRLQKVAQNSVEAEKAYKKVLEYDGTNEDALTGLAVVYSDLGDNKRAAELLKQVTDRNPSARGLQALAETYEQMREFSMAAATLKRMLEFNPQNALDVKRAMAQDLIFASKFPEALAAYQELVSEEPGDALSYLRMSQVYRQLKDFSKAREASEKALAADPDNLEVRYNAVSILEAEGKTTEAIQALNGLMTATTRRNYNQVERAARAALLERLAALHRSIDQTDPAVDAYRQIIQLDPGQAARREAEIVDTYRLGKQFTKASEEAEASIKKWPTDRTLIVVRATLMADMGKVDPAAADVRKLLDGKNDLETQLALAQIYEKGKRYDDMSKALDAAEKVASNQDEKVNIWFERGVMFEKQKKLAPAEAEFRKILQGDPDHSATLNYLGYILADRNVRLQEALGMITKALEQEPNNGAYLDSLGWVYYRLGRLPEAEENLRKAAERTPLDPTMHDHLAEVLMSRSKVREAVAQWQLSLQQWDASAPAELDQAEIAKVRTKLENARMQLAREGALPNQNQQ